MQHPAGMLIAKPAEGPIGAAGIEGEDRLQRGRTLFRHRQLFGAKARYPDHAHIAVAPRLGGDPGDEVMAIPLPRASALRRADPARLADHMHIAARHEKAGVARLQQPRPERRPGGLRRQASRIIRPLQVLVVDGEGEERGKAPLHRRPIDIRAQLHAIAHGHGLIALGDHPVIVRRALVSAGRRVACLEDRVLRHRGALAYLSTKVEASMLPR